MFIEWYERVSVQLIPIAMSILSSFRCNIALFGAKFISEFSTINLEYVNQYFAVDRVHLPKIMRNKFSSDFCTQINVKFQ